MLCHSDYAERVVASLTHQVQSKCYGGNRYASIECIALYNFIDTKTSLPLSTSQYFIHNSVFQSFLYDDSKQDDATTAAHRKLILFF